MNELYSNAAAIAHSEYVRTGVMPDIGLLMRELEEEEAIISAAGAEESESENAAIASSEDVTWEDEEPHVPKLF